MPQVWTDRDDRLPGTCPAGPVADGEEVARLLNTEMSGSSGGITEATFPRDALVRPANPNNEIGARDGESLLRRAGRTDDELIEASIKQYEGKQRPSAGIAIGDVTNIRALRAPHAADLQLFYIYEDPNREQLSHAVIRFSDHASLAGYYRLARRSLIALFTHIAA